MKSLVYGHITETAARGCGANVPGSRGGECRRILYIDRQRFLMFCTAKAARDLMFLADGEQGPAALDQRGETLAAMEDSVRKPAGLAGCP